MSTDQNIAVVRKMLEIVATGDLSEVEQIISPNWVNNDPSMPPMSGIDGFKQLVGIWTGSLSNAKLDVEDIIGASDMVASHFMVSGIHTGDLMGVPPTGKQVKSTGTGIFRLENGKVVENTVNFDALGLLQQLGVVPMPK